MKRVSFLVSVLFALFLISCDNSGIVGEGEIKIRSVELPDKIEGIKFYNSADVYLVQSAVQDVILEGQDNILDNLKLNVKDNVLEVDEERNVRQHDVLRIYISMETLKQISLFGSGTIRTENTFEGLERIVIRLSGSGNIEAEMESEKTEVRLSGSGKVALEGRTTEATLELSGSGNIDAESYLCEKVQADISGSGNIKVAVERYLDVDITGSGSVYYRGTPETVSTHIEGSGNVKKF
ncbi:head GIN domain-containing protein [Limibacter armeniacum]|uniref:head GIN domain-containing protein n=1 Tax=Limibacter armeniacum TaxID=466084 RepID=UPI002FE5DCA3